MLAGCAVPGPGPSVTAGPVVGADGAETRLHLLNRVTWGASTSTARQLEALGSERYIEQQLKPGPAALPPEVQAQIDAMTISQRTLDELVLESSSSAGDALAKRAMPEKSKLAQQAYQQELTRLGREAADARAAARALFAQPAAGADDVVLDEPLQRLPVQGQCARDGRRLRGERHPPARARPLPRPARRHRAPPGDAALSRQRAERARTASTRTTRAS